MVQPKRKRPIGSPDLSHPTPLRTPTILQRISSFMPSLPHRKTAPRQRPKSAPALGRHTPPGRRTWYPFRQGEQEPLLPPKLSIPTLSDEPCPNDPNIYYSFPNIEKKRCNDYLCNIYSPGSGRSSTGADWTSGATASIRRCSLSRPCTPGRAGIPCAHLAMNRPNTRSPASGGRTSKQSAGSSRGTSRAATPSRVQFDTSSSRRPSAIRIPALSSLSPSRGLSPSARPPTRRGPTPENQSGLTFDNIRERSTSPGSPKRKTPSPDFHHILGIDDLRYVNRQQVEQYRAASPAADHAEVSLAAPDSGRRLDTPPVMSTILEELGLRPRRESNAGTVGSHTVFYPRSPYSSYPVLVATTTESARVDLSATVPFPPQLTPSVNSNAANISPPILQPRPSNAPLAMIADPLPATATMETVQASGTITVDRNGRPISVDLELETTEVYRVRRSPHRNPNRTPATQEIIPGNGESSTSSTQTTTDNPAQTPSTLGGQRLELRGGVEGSPRLRGGGAGRTRSDTIQSISSSITSFRRRIKDVFFCIPRSRILEPEDLPPARVHLDFVDPLSSGNARVGMPTLRGGSITKTQEYTPRLRGGGGVPNLENDDERLPWRLWYMAGGLRSPITAGEWRKQRPKKRMSGLFGMAVFGQKSGMPYTERGSKGSSSSSSSSSAPAPSAKSSSSSKKSSSSKSPSSSPQSEAGETRDKAASVVEGSVSARQPEAPGEISPNSGDSPGDTSVNDTPRCAPPEAPPDEPPEAPPEASPEASPADAAPNDNPDNASAMKSTATSVSGDAAAPNAEAPADLPLNDGAAKNLDSGEGANATAPDAIDAPVENTADDPANIPQGNVSAEATGDPPVDDTGGNINGGVAIPENNVLDQNRGGAAAEYYASFAHDHRDVAGNANIGNPALRGGAGHDLGLLD